MILNTKVVRMAEKQRLEKALTCVKALKRAIDRSDTISKFNTTSAVESITRIIETEREALRSQMETEGDLQEPWALDLLETNGVRYEVIAWGTGGGAQLVETYLLCNCEVYTHKSRGSVIRDCPTKLQRKNVLGSSHRRADIENRFENLIDSWASEQEMEAE